MSISPCNRHIAMSKFSLNISTTSSGLLVLYSRFPRRMDPWGRLDLPIALVYWSMIPWFCWIALYLGLVDFQAGNLWALTLTILCLCLERDEEWDRIVLSYQVANHNKIVWPEPIKTKTIHPSQSFPSEQITPKMAYKKIIENLARFVTLSCQVWEADFSHTNSNDFCLHQVLDANMYYL